jgi:hypothetical protein
MPPYWWFGPQNGPKLLRCFPRLQEFILVIPEGFVEEIKERTLAELEAEKSRCPEWQMPMITFREDNMEAFVQWLRFLFPEHQRRHLLYEWARE